MKQTEKMVERVNDMHLQLELLKENLSQCLIAMHLLSDDHERVVADKLLDAFAQTLDSPIAEVLSELPTDNIVAFVAAFAALNLAYTSINAYSAVRYGTRISTEAWERDLRSGIGNRDAVLQ